MLSGDALSDEIYKLFGLLDDEQQDRALVLIREVFLREKSKEYPSTRLARDL